jgi:glycosyltransferase involved in cell wall biosynthesis
MSGIHWKWRMHGGAITLAQKLNNSNFIPDLIIVTDMVNLGDFKSLLKKQLKQIPIILYFHENQLMYPKTKLDTDNKQQRDNHYGFINFTSSLIADKILFNSNFHKNGFINSLNKFLSKFPDYSLKSNINEISNKSSVLPIGIKMNDKVPLKTKNKIPIILWNHRWEHDKNPEDFFNILFQLKKDSISFKLNIIGENFKNSPEIFQTAKEKLKDEVINWGFIQSKEEYFKILSESDLLLVTSNHDFFGISIIEAISFGVFPLLPNRLAYPEHIPNELKKYCFYNNNEDVLIKLKEILNNKPTNYENLLSNHIQKYELNKVINDYDNFFNTII